jgi:hypothetical protein
VVVQTVAFETVLVLHVLSVVAGYGSVFFEGAWIQLAERTPGSVGAPIAEASLAVVVKRAAIALYLVPVFGILLVLLSHRAFSFGDWWVVVGLADWVATIVLLHLVYRPAQARLMAAAVQVGGGCTAVEDRRPALARRARLAIALVDLLFVATLVVMIVGPVS